LTVLENNGAVDAVFVYTVAVDTVALKVSDDPGIDASGTDVDIRLRTAELLSEVKLPRDSVPDDKDAGNSAVDKEKRTPGVAASVAFVSIEELIVAVEDTLVGDNVFGGSVTLAAVAVVEALSSVADA